MLGHLKSHLHHSLFWMGTGTILPLSFLLLKHSLLWRGFMVAPIYILTYLSPCHETLIDHLLHAFLQWSFLSCQYSDSTFLRLLSLMVLKLIIFNRIKNQVLVLMIPMDNREKWNIFFIIHYFFCLAINYILCSRFRVRVGLWQIFILLHQAWINPWIRRPSWGTPSFYNTTLLWLQLIVWIGFVLLNGRA